jgi:hypothetical protein
MQKVNLEQLRLLDLAGIPVDLSAYFQRYLLLIFLRHLA